MTEWSCAFRCCRGCCVLRRSRVPRARRSCRRLRCPRHWCCRCRRTCCEACPVFHPLRRPPTPASTLHQGALDGHAWLWEGEIPPDHAVFGQKASPLLRKDTGCLCGPLSGSTLPTSSAACTQGRTRTCVPCTRAHTHAHTQAHTPWGQSHGVVMYVSEHCGVAANVLLAGQKGGAHFCPEFLQRLCRIGKVSQSTNG